MSEVLDLRRSPPRRWSVEIGGIAWLPRLVDKARAAANGTLGGYLYGQSPMDRSLLQTLGLGYRRFSEIVRGADNDEAVLAGLLSNDPQSLDRARAWSARLAPEHKLFLWIMDFDDGYHPGARWLKAPANVASNAFTWAVKRVFPSRSAGSRG